MTPMNANKWPKRLPPLSQEQQAISDDFMKYWHEVLPRRFGIIERFNHGYVVQHAPKHFRRTLEIGAGLGEHLEYETLTDDQRCNYFAFDIRPTMVTELRGRFPDVKAGVADCQERMDFPDGFFDRILAVHVLEHLPDLPSAIREIYRLCDKERGVFSIVIPCEGGFAYSLARQISAQRVFERRYKQSYRWFIEREHLSTPIEIFEELSPFFSTIHSSYFPLRIPLEFCNLCIGITLRPKRQVEDFG